MEFNHDFYFVELKQKTIALFTVLVQRLRSCKISIMRVVGKIERSVHSREDALQKRDLEDRNMMRRSEPTAVTYKQSPDGR